MTTFSRGPVYVEGKLVLPLSFASDTELAPHNNEPEIEQFKLWDFETNTWLDYGPVLRRFEYEDQLEQDGRVVWAGALDTQAEVIASLASTDGLPNFNATHIWKLIQDPSLYAF